MIPGQNTSHVVLSFPFERITDLIEAMRDAAILPRKYPANVTWGTIEIPVPRIDLGFRVRFRAELGPMKVEAWQPQAIPEFRLGATITVMQFVLEAFELSQPPTVPPLASIDYAVSGRVYISGSIERRSGEKGLFFVLRRVRATPDDSSAGLPAPWPEVDLEEILTRIADRAVRAQLVASAPLPERALPVSTELETTGLIGVPLELNYAVRDPANTVDWLSFRQCLPPGLGDPGCSPGAGVTLPLFDRLDVYAAPAGSPPPVHVNLVNPAKQFQIDIGIDLLRRALNQARKPSWQGETKFGPFRFVHNLDVDIRPWPGSTDGSIGIWFSFTGEHDLWYPKIKWCQGETFGIKYDYPCGFEDGWTSVQSVRIEMMFRLYSDPSGRICIERTTIVYDFDQSLIGTLYAVFLAGLVSAIPFVGPIIASTFLFAETMITFIVGILAALIVELINILVPNQYCAAISDQFARIPLIGDRVDVDISHPFLEMKTNGVTVAFDGDFEKR